MLEEGYGSMERKFKYTGNFFKENLPEWKRRKDPVLSRIFYRPVSFYVAALFANCGITANAVSYFSMVPGLTACMLLAIGSHAANVAAALLVNLWLILDCTDGNLARSVKAQPFGDFADGMASAVFSAFLYFAAGVSVYRLGGIWMRNGELMSVALGGMASVCNILMRYVYQRYTNHEKMLMESGKLSQQADMRKDTRQVDNWKVRLESFAFEGGIIPAFLLVCAVLKCLDIFLIYAFALYTGSSLIKITEYIVKAVRATREIEAREKKDEKNNNIRDF